MVQESISLLILHINKESQSQWLRVLRHRSATTHLVRLWFQNPPRAWMSLCCEYCVLSGRGLRDKLLTCSEDSHWLWCIVVCDEETSWMRRPWPTGGLWLEIRKYCVECRLNTYLPYFKISQILKCGIKDNLRNLLEYVIYTQKILYYLHFGW